MARSTWFVPVLVLAAGCDFLKPVENTPSPTPTNEVYYTAIGASDAIGFGGSSPCLPFTACTSGTGYVQTIYRQLVGTGKTVQFLNLGIPGAVLGPDTEALGASYGRDIFGNFLQREVPFLPRATTVVTVFAGGNDVNTVGGALRAGLGGANPTAFVQQQTTIFARDLQLLVSGIRDRAPTARIVMLNLPNMAAMPYASGLTLVEKQTLQQISVAFSAQVNALTSQGVFVVDLMCDAPMYQPQMFSSDGFHPNDAGYARLTTLTFDAVNGVDIAGPRASCSQMTLY
jgi:lysophospholipase L1-like esterase